MAVDNAPAQRLYATYGFEPIGVRRGYYQPSNTDALVMRRDADRPQTGRTMADEPLILGIETSCDETGVGIVRGHTLLADALASSVDEHARFGGVVPEVASRAHLEAIVPTMDRALDEAGVDPRRHRRDRGHRRARAWPARCWSGWPPPRATRSPPRSRSTG